MPAVAAPRLLAKQPHGTRVITLPEHTRSVVRAAEALFGTTTHLTTLGSRWLRFFRLTNLQQEPFLRNLKLAAIFHDLGKANSGFQNALLHQGEQAFRHEHLSALLLWEPPLRDWLSAGEGVNPHVVVSAVVSHHHKVNPTEMAAPLVPLASVRLLLDSPDFMETLQIAEPVLGPVPSLAGLPRSYRIGENLEEPLQRFREDFYRFKRTLGRDGASARMLPAVKSALLAADAAGSAFCREGIDPELWAAKCFGGSDLAATEVEEKILSPRLREIESRTGSPFRWHDFQVEAGALGPRALLLAGCGSGKTLAALRWMQSQADSRPVSRAILLYPTRATATEGFRDYVSWAGGEDAALVHGTSAYDLEGLFPNPDDVRGKEDFSTQERLFALGFWPRRFFSATVDSFLGFMAHQYASACLLPVLADAVVVVDEVHSFSRSMFTALERFLNYFDIPVLCMTATLTQDRLRILRDRCCLQVFPNDPSRFHDLQAQQEAPRYTVRIVPSDSAGKVVRDALERGARVLWVANTVSRCQQNTLLMRAWCGERKVLLLCYHSRFRLMDRKKHHDDIISLFRRERSERGEAFLVTTTQVCQMSLDLDADLVVTEIAPVPDLVQRMGRCCRVPHPGTRRGSVLAYTPPDAKPYSPEEMMQGEDFLKAMAAREEISQLDLARYLESMAIAEPQPPEGYAGFLDAGWYAMSKDDTFRDEQEFNEDCILDADLEAYLAARRERKPWEGFVLPVPRRFALDTPALGPRLKAAPVTHYDPELGFMTEAADA